MIAVGAVFFGTSVHILASPFGPLLGEIEIPPYRRPFTDPAIIWPE